MVKLKPPRSVGVPMIVPAALFNESPGGSDPAVTAQVTVRPLVLPATPREPEYGTSTVASVRFSGSTAHSSELGLRRVSAKALYHWPRPPAGQEYRRLQRDEVPP